MWVGEYQQSTSKASSNAVPETDVDGNMTVYVTKSGKKYHLESCRWDNTPISLDKARETYTLCGVCNSPK